MIVMKKILIRKILMKKIKYGRNYSRMRLVFIFEVQMIHRSILPKKGNIFQVTHVILSDFNSF